ncbi:MAG: 2Fe-2S iron-sulfur cluster binding domain-containing protein [Pseudonocardia sp.]|nr:2Fe-2S iron-sulfur cluster binding domain-containing protein [Pseudonocardia sp.]
MSAEAVSVAFRLNGRPVRVEVERDDTLASTLRRLGEYTVRESCGVGLCGCCAVRVDGEAVSSCLFWARKVEGREVRTLDGLAEDPRAALLQKAIGDSGAAQCGYCTPGMVITALDLVGTGSPASSEEVRERMSGNLCRCACYPQLIDAIRTASSGRPTATGPGSGQHNT